ncbi:B12-binding domain-containing radical SAM protein [Xanthobacter sp. KR7-65]|uniref:B12-binding domain-containing radical SAM protein n=1 Tax=Xanthobacter sp. KR7-65 TaxID=3156612 RepID=UPI0032B3ED93
MSQARILLVYPRFVQESFWRNLELARLRGARCMAPPLGLLTVAAMLPVDWEVRLVDCNVRDLSAEDLAWADAVFLSAMLPQRLEALRLIDRVAAAGKVAVMGGPDVSSSPQAYAAAPVRVLGEAEAVLPAFIAAWEAGFRDGLFEAGEDKPDVTRTPVPRFDLITFSDYLFVGVQFSRGCPFTCEFCDIIELYGRVPRAKATDQMLAELDALHTLGYRGHVDFVDDNLIGNKKAVKAFLPHLIAWQKARGHPFHFSTEASLNLADDAELLRLLSEAGFFLVFVGIESPDADVLRSTQKKQNTRRDIAASVHRIYAAGLVVIAGFIIGFDNEPAGIGDMMVELIEEAAIPVASLGLLYALPDTQLSRRLEREGRMFELKEEDFRFGDQTGAGLNFATLGPRVDVLRAYRETYARIYTPAAFFGRVRRLGELLRRPEAKAQEGALAAGAAVAKTPEPVDLRTLAGDLARLFAIMLKVSVRHPRTALHIWPVVLRGLKRLDTLEQLLSLSLFYIHLGRFAQSVDRTLADQIADIESGRWRDPRERVAQERAVITTAAE